MRSCIHDRGVHGFKLDRFQTQILVCVMLEAPKHHSHFGSSSRSTTAPRCTDCRRQPSSADIAMAGLLMKAIVFCALMLVIPAREAAMLNTSSPSISPMAGQPCGEGLFCQEGFQCCVAGTCCQNIALPVPACTVCVPPR